MDDAEVIGPAARIGTRVLALLPLVMEAVGGISATRDNAGSAEAGDRLAAARDRLCLRCAESERLSVADATAIVNAHLGVLIADTASDQRALDASRRR